MQDTEEEGLGDLVMCSYVRWTDRWQCQKKNLEAFSCRLEDRALVRQCQYHASLTTPGMVQHEMGIITVIWKRFIRSL